VARRQLCSKSETRGPSEPLTESARHHLVVDCEAGTPSLKRTSVSIPPDLTRRLGWERLANRAANGRVGRGSGAAGRS
jgi:hypothetical protein